MKRSPLSTRVEVHIRDRGVHTHAVEAVSALFKTVDRIFDPTDPDSAVSMLNRGEVTPQDCRRLVGEVMALCESARHRTDGFFDAGPMPGVERRLWFDPSGVVRGWALERAALLLDTLGIQEYCLDLDGDAVVRLARPTSSPWRVGIDDPTDPGHPLAVIPLTGGAIATSTRRPGDATALWSVSVVGPSLMWADVYASAARVRGAGGLDWLARQAGYEALAVDGLGRMRMTSGMRSMLANATSATPLRSHAALRSTAPMRLALAAPAALSPTR